VIGEAAGSDKNAAESSPGISRKQQ
jgi:hypothetical protein